MMSIGEKLRHFRELRNLNQEHLADAIGVRQPHYSRIENGADITFSQLEKAAKALDIKVQDLITFDTAQYFNKVENNHIGQIGFNFYNSSLVNDVQELKTRCERLEKKMEKIERGLNS